MQYRKLCGEEISILGFGAMRFPTLENEAKDIDEEKSEKMLDYAIENGVNYIDTAYPYHKEKSELFVGEYLTKRKLRDKIYLAAKLPMWKLEKREDLDTIFSEQLEKLQTDHIDFYLLHALNKKSWKKAKDLNVIEWCEKQKSQGSIKHLGFSFHDQYEVFEQIINDYNNWEFCQIQYNYMDVDFQAGSKGFDYAVGKGLDIIVMEPLRGGQLSKEPPKEIKKIWQINALSAAIAKPNVRKISRS